MQIFLMKLNLSMFSFTVSGFSVTIRKVISDYFHIPLSEDKQGRWYLELMYAGTALKDNWSLADVGISFCSTLKCSVKEEDKSILYVFNGVTQETMPIMEGTSLLGKKVSDLRTLVTLRCGFPVSVYCLRTPKGLEMHNIRLDVWDGWKEFLMGCLLGQKLKVQRYLSKEGPQGVRPHEAVGVHPYQAWCHEALHADVSKCPIHAAAEAGQLLILKAFVNCSVLCLECKNAAGQTPLNIAFKHKHKDCVLYLLSKMWSVVSFLKISSHGLHKSQLCRARVFGAKVGDAVMVDGFTEPKMTSKSWHKAGNKDSQSTVRKLPPLMEQTANRKPSNPLAISQPDTREQTLKFPPLVDANTVGYSHPSFYYATPSADFLLRSSFASFSEHSGKTPRENAIYCLAMASAFKEKQWLQQLEIARVLAKKSISNLTLHGGLTAHENPPEIVL
uniref:Ankyrin repeat and ubiquitin domain containing 1 n=1 Tax=Propithecus coquereli TaxID=379532 RepID=A0A2K6FZ10_PROCO